MDKDEPRIVRREPLAVRLAQRGAGNNDGLAGIESLEGQRAHSVEPGRTVGVCECLASPHLLDARRRVRVICVHEPRANLTSEFHSDGRLSGARGSDEHDGAWSTSHVALFQQSHSARGGDGGQVLTSTNYVILNRLLWMGKVVGER